MLAVFGIDCDGLNLAVNLLILFLVVIYLALVVLDVRGRAAADRRPDAHRLRDGRDRCSRSSGRSST